MAWSSSVLMIVFSTKIPELNMLSNSFGERRLYDFDKKSPSCDRN